MSKHPITKSFFGFLRQPVKKINDEVLLLAVVLASISALVAVINKQFPKWIGITFVLLYLIAVMYFLAQKCMKIKAQSKERASNPTFQLRICYPHAFYNVESMFGETDCYCEESYSSKEKEWKFRN